MKLFHFEQTSAFAGGGEAALTGPAEGRQGNPFGGGAAETGCSGSIRAAASHTRSKSSGGTSSTTCWTVTGNLWLPCSCRLGFQWIHLLLIPKFDRRGSRICLLSFEGLQMLIPDPCG